MAVTKDGKQVGGSSIRDQRRKEGWMLMVEGSRGWVKEGHEDEGRRQKARGG